MSSLAQSEKIVALHSKFTDISLFLGVTGSTKRLGTVRPPLSQRSRNLSSFCAFTDILFFTGSLAYLPRKRASRHRGKVKRLVNIR